MRGRGRVETEIEGNSRGRSRARSTHRKPYGYIHNVDQMSTSFFVTNFPQDCTSEDLWKGFARYVSVGDVYIPNKVDKWGRRKEEAKKECLDRPKGREVGKGSVQMGVSFKTALVNTTKAQEVREKGLEEVENVLKVEVGGRLLNELDRSFVGKLALNVEGAELALFQGDRDEEQDHSWVESLNFPGEALEDYSGVHGGSMEEGDDYICHQRPFIL
ncbi:hypothetical protein TSUD_19970 [Trifolium subterraneum]|uniref:RRM domain-containing protein n=1 Tax=Trifolium subterraneum TaxID=3900 RepID=A0A2Z6MSD4_TRISU|nr:hypothetical protein TSUD_19970 [Trifolium subterraneum]